jgi:dethiobiotin synthetase
MKPVAAGAVRLPEGLINEDVERLLAAGNVATASALINPYCFEPAIAPHIAAAQAGITIDLERIVRAYASLSAGADRVVVEGAGGFCVPLNRHETTADVAGLLGLPVVLVVGVRPGCLNHALLTVQSIHARGLKLAGWVSNQIDPAMPAARENIAALAERLAAPLLATLPFVAAPDFRRVAAQLDLTGLT